MLQGERINDVPVPGQIGGLERGVPRYPAVFGEPREERKEQAPAEGNSNSVKELLEVFKPLPTEEYLQM
jgi:hypothetical protein